MAEVKRQIFGASVMLGCDPELFLTTKDGQVVGSERYLPEAGLTGVSGQGTACKVILDGVQVELNPPASHCRQELASRIGAAMAALKVHLAGKDVVAMVASGSAVVEVSAEELNRLSEKSKMLGCAPSNNYYDKGMTIDVNPATYTKRSAGGHIHLGFSGSPELMNHREELVPILDALLGNTSVMIDLDPNAAERRKVYGRAGETRSPYYGLEYRTLSNFWLRSYPLMSGVFAIARHAVSVLNTKYYYPQHGWDAPAALAKCVDQGAVVEAINTNNLQLAKENWKGIRKFLASVAGCSDGIMGNETRLTQMDHFLRRIEEVGLGYWFPEDPITHWATRSNPYQLSGQGWEGFLAGRVQNDISGLGSVSGLGISI